MLITKTQHEQNMYSKSFDAGFKNKTHLERHIVTTYWFLFIPIYRNKKLTSSNL